MHACAFEQSLRAPDSGAWNKDTLARITLEVDIEGYRVREANPCSALIYARLMSIAVDYLRARPNKNGSRYFRHRIREDMGSLARVVHPELSCGNLPYYIGTCFQGIDLVLLQVAYLACRRRYAQF